MEHTGLPAEIQSAVLEHLGAIELLRSAGTSRQFRALAADILNRRDEADPQMWRVATPPRTQSWAPPPAGTGTCAWQGDLEPLPACKTRAELAERLLWPALRRALVGMQFVPELALVFYTEACRPASTAPQAAAITREIAADAAAWLPASAAIVVVRSTGVLATGLCSCDPGEPTAVEEEVGPLLVVQLVRLPGVRIQWLALGDASVAQNKIPKMNRVDRMIKVAGEVERHAAEWWRREQEAPPSQSCGFCEGGGCRWCGSVGTGREAASYSRTLEQVVTTPLGLRDVSWAESESKRPNPL